MGTAKLIVKKGSDVKEFPIEGVVTIGRQSTNTVQLLEEKASRQHARIMPSGAEVLIEDLNSSNGTRVNGRRITRCSLKPGDVIRIGETAIIYQDDAFVGLPKAEANAQPDAGDDPLVGKTLGGYQLISLLGQGGMGAVYKARQLSMDRLVALKMLKAELAENRDFVKRFLQEARVAGRLTHPALIQVHDFGEAENVLYFSMEYVDGETVRDVLRRENKISPGKALDIAIEVAEALVQAGRNQIVHQDIKPQNIMLDRHERVKLADLGLAAIAGQEKDKRRRNILMGTPHYMAPEQSKQEAIDARTDIYALGVTLFHMVTGRIPFDGPNTLAILTKHITMDRPDIRQYDASLPSSLARLIQRMMAVVPAERPGDAAQLLTALRSLRTEVKAWEEKKSRRTLAAANIRKQASQSAPAIAASAAPAPVEEQERRQIMAERLRENRRGRLVSSLIKTGVLITAVLIGVLITLIMVHKQAPVAGPEIETTPPERDQQTIAIKTDKKTGEPTAGETKTAEPTPKTVLSPPVIPETKTDDGGVMKGETDEMAAYRAAIAVKDRCVAAGDFGGARRALTELLVRRPNHPERAQLEKLLGELDGLRRDATERAFDEIEAKRRAKQFRAAVAVCTRLLSAEPDAETIAKIRDLLEKIDAESKPVFEEFMQKSRTALKNGRPDQATGILGAALDAIGGTRWGREISIRHLQLVFAQKLLRELEQAVKKHSPKVSVPSLMTGKIADGVAKELRGLALMVALQNAVVPMKLEALPPDELRGVLRQCGLERDHTGAAALFELLGRSKEAAWELEKAGKIPEQAVLAARLANADSGGEACKYDFSQWRQLDDWTALSGQWLMMDGKYILESTEGGETSLKPAAFGKDFSGRNAQLGFELEPQNPGKDFFCIVEFGRENRMIELFFSSKGCEMKTHLGTNDGAVLADWKPDGASRIELRCVGESVELHLNGKNAASLPASAGAHLKSGLTFRVRNARCSFDNIVIRADP